ncbi:MAG TPA: glycerate kinase [Casimicrobium huifangae]|mgnify:CR=1 FL=1|jgi:glycerate kinase|uniref:glycerate kinase n=1 Tax=Casimicrobium huifangae TaxID=2591109 RepID=UPI0012EB0EAC|nr:glycerate kinase [Casimicrobium huifangae]HOB00747.1 glycerate kinase [Casimicrobium huifangae]HQA32205.1 glycerate kinase [Casimicrobium huifangae]HQD65170.1 glycerate kinase [Casimicrobium huifangae]
MKIVLAPDSFKGSLSAESVCDALQTGLKRVLPAAEIVRRPMADGGEGTLDAVVTALASSGGARRKQALVKNAAGQSAEAAYALIKHGIYEAAVIEVAQIVGIEDAHNMAIPVADRSSYGVGELIRLLLTEGIRHFFVGLGGTSSNDGGAGLLAALGVKFTGTFRREIAPSPNGLAKLISVDVTGLDARLADCEITLLSDVNNPLTGERGATAIFGPQKGVAMHDVAKLDAVIDAYADRLEAALQRHAKDKPGAGAAGGLGYALQLLGAKFESGAQTVARLTGLADACKGADWLITGEGRSDAQTLLGKTPFAAAQIAREYGNAGLKATLLSGGVDATALAALNETFNGGCFSIVPGPMALDQAVIRAPELLANAAEQIARIAGLHAR